MNLSFFPLLIFLLAVSFVTKADEKVALDESRVIEMALSQNAAIQDNKLQSKIAFEDIASARSVFDSFFAGSVTRSIDQQEQAISVFGTDNRTTDFSASLSKTFPTGTQFELEWLTTHNRTNPAFSSLNPYFDSSFGLNVRQPLLKNAAGFQDRGQVMLAKKHFEALDRLSQRRIATEIYRVLGVYWKWVTWGKVLQITQSSVDEASEFLTLAYKKKKLGWYDFSDVLAAQANLNLMKDLLEETKLSWELAGLDLKRSLFLDSASQLQSAEPLIVMNITQDEQNLIDTALTRRNDLKAATVNRKAAELETSLSANKMLPQLDAVVGLSSNGIDPNFNSSIHGALQRNQNLYTFGGELTFSLENRKAVSNWQQAKLNKYRSTITLDDTQKAVLQDIESFWTEVETRKKQADLGLKLEQIQKKKYAEELKKYKNGLSSGDLVSRFQEDYLKARRHYLQAVYVHRLAFLGLQLANDTLIENKVQ